MKTFDWTSFTKRIAIKADIKTLYNAWTRPTEIERWFLKNADFFDSSNNKIGKEANAQKGFAYRWIWHLYEDIVAGSITEANGSNYLQFTFEGNSLVDVKLSPEGEYTLVELTQKEIPTDEQSMQYIRLGCASGWAFYLVNLKSVYEGGMDLRNKDTALQPMINN